MIWKKSDAEENPIPSHQPLPQPSQAPPPRTSAPAPQPTRERALIGSSIEIKGDLLGQEDLFVEGRIEGKIQVREHSITIGKSGRVRADVYGRSIVVQGELEGNLYGEEQIVLRQSSTVRGNLVAPRVTLEDGANFKGSIDMTAKESGSAQPAKAAGMEARSAAQPSPKPEKI